MESPGLPYAIAERGKLYALAGNHIAAMTLYREAMSLAVKQGAPEVMFRHYMECALESLERMGEYADVLDYCERAIAHYQENPPAHRLAHLDLATIWQRRGVVALKQGQHDAARAALRQALDGLAGCAALDGEAPVDLPLARTLLRWLEGRMHIPAARLESELVRHAYYSVRRDTVSESRALPADHPLAAALPFSRQENK